MSKAWRMWAQPWRKICTTSTRSCTRSKCVFTACGCVVTWLSASAVAKILTRMVSILGTSAGRARSIPRGRLVVLLLLVDLTVVALPVMGPVVSGSAVIRRQRLAVLRRDLH